MKLELKNIEICYEKNIVLKNVNLILQKGHFYGLFGKSGSGKTTLLKSILNHDFIQNGEIKYNNEDIIVNNNSKYQKRIIKNNFNKFKNNIGFLFQENNLLNTYDVYDNVRLLSENIFKNKFFKILRILTKKNKSDLIEKLNILEIEDKIFTPVSELSGGQRRKVELAIFLMDNKKIIFADEPTTGLDTKNAKLVFKLLKDYAINNEAIVLCSIHDIENSLDYIDEAIFIKNKKVFENINLKNLTKEEINEFYD
ncbi:ABC transporter ATP-binding protein [Mycoplasmopsis maculosa]|uniref:ABC transporter ATP-binding protein n=1 Tax=Mycoplasmopsis maculosa TaxID=114885 RepID=A0A449B3J6_9BACT|nr:ATP-binding cassette domain-containing protein [Mycoplasmopsis maculosa]VEU75145.1 ABC transporter ATP-binding protein [Mycoplasmopsis maculosa]